MLREGKKEGKKDMKDRRGPGVKRQNVFSQPRFGDNNTDFDIACTPNPTMSLVSVKRSPHWSCDESIKASFSEISLRFLCAHGSSYDWMPFCSCMSACGMHE